MLLALLRDHGEVLEVDLQREFRVDLGDVWRGRMSLRRLRVLVSGLPPDCATAHALSGTTGPLTSWSLTDLLLGRLADELAVFRWQWESAHVDPKKSSPRKQPPSVLPDVTTTPTSQADVPVVSPHRLGSFVNEEVPTHGV